MHGPTCYSKRLSAAVSVSRLSSDHLTSSNYVGNSSSRFVSLRTIAGAKTRNIKKRRREYMVDYALEDWDKTNQEAKTFREFYAPHAQVFGGMKPPSPTMNLTFTPSKVKSGTTSAID